MTFYILLPLLLTVGIALTTHSPIGAPATRSLGRVGAVSLTTEVLITGAAFALVVVSLDQPREERCPLSEVEYGAAIALLFATAIAGGVLLASVIADARRHRGMLVWHLFTAPAAVVLPYVVLSALLYWGLTCTS